MDLIFPTTADVLGRFLEAHVVGDGAAPVRSLAAFDAAGDGDLTFLADKQYTSRLGQLKGTVLLASSDLVDPQFRVTYLVVKNPRLAFAEIARKLSQRPRPLGVSPQAFVHPTARLGKVSIGPFATVEEGASIADGVTIHAGAYIGPEVQIGEDTEIFPKAVLLERVRVGARVKIFPGAVIGSDGFGLLAGGDGKTSQMPQIGIVVLEDDVRVGAHCTIDRATLGETRIESGVKLDDQVHIGHNCIIGKNSILCAQVGIAGSCVIEEGAILAGQVGVADHVRIGKGARLGGQSGISTNIEGGETYFGSPAVPLKDSLRIVRYLRKLPEFFQRLKRLEERIEGKSNG